MQKRYEYWCCEDGKVIKKFTDWFEYNSTLKPKYQLSTKLRNEYRE